MTSAELVDQSSSPGPNYVYGTDTGGYKDWISGAAFLAAVLTSTGPTEHEITVSASTWTWTHGLGYRPLVEIQNSAREVVVAHVTHTDENTITVQHTYNLTGFIVVR
jgi:hypothetical protein